MTGLTPEQRQTSRTATAIILRERNRQHFLWGEQTHSLCRWISILTEEVGECAKAVNDREQDVHLDDQAHLQEILTEASHVGAVALQIIEALAAILHKLEHERPKTEHPGRVPTPVIVSSIKVSPK